MTALPSHLRGPRGLITLTLLFNLPFVLLRVQRFSYDAYTHIFFADHYRGSWWTLWEPRWYLGFSVASYPPLVHQLIALLSWPISALITAFAPEPEPYPGAFRWLGLEAAYVVLLLAVLCAFPLAVREFARVFVGPRATDWAALLAVFLPALLLSGWAFGQLPTLAATTALLLALARGAAFLQSGRALRSGEGEALRASPPQASLGRAPKRSLMQAVALAALAGALHHAALLFAPFGALAIIGVRRPDYALRLIVWAALSALAVAAVLWPFLEWSRGQSLQTPIDHASRYNFLLQPQATLVFFWPLHGTMLLMIPAALWLTAFVPRRTCGRRLRPVALTWLALFVLSLGGTTPLPRWLFGAGWEWLTYDRFGLWASVTLLPLAGAVLLMAARRFGRGAALAFVVALGASGLVAGFHSVLVRAQPPGLDLTPLVRFLNEPEQRPYHYLTLGFGDQLAKLATVTHNGTPDGTYHTARPLPELRASGLGALDGALWNPQGVWAVAPFLREPQRYGLRWVFSHHPAYEPVLRTTGWTYRFDVGQVKAWERAEVEPLPVTAPPENVWAAWWWGSAPLVTLALAAFLLFWSPLDGAGRSQVTRIAVLRSLAGLRRALLILTIALLSWWWVHVARGGPGDLPHLYFTYQSVLVFASDVALALTLGVWALERGLRGARPSGAWDGEALRTSPSPLCGACPSRAWLTLGPRPVLWAGSAVIVTSALSLWRAVDAGLTLAFVLHLGLLAGLYVMWLNDPPGVRVNAMRSTLGLVFGAVVVAQSGIVLLQALTQSAVVPRELGLRWPGMFEAQTPGASVVLDAAGERWLRAYGTLPHPNVLGAFLLVYSTAVLERWLTTGKQRWLIVLGLGAACVALTFSRAAWVGALALAATAWWLTPHTVRVRLQVALAMCAIAGSLILLPLTPFLISRVNVVEPANRLEAASTLERMLLIGYSVQAWQAEPVTGVGAGGFVQWAARHTGEALPFQPVHNVPLLILAETGWLGGAAALALLVVVTAQFWRRRSTLTASAAVWSAALVAIAVTGLFDHLWWTQPPARALAVCALANWVVELPTCDALQGASHVGIAANGADLEP